MVDRYMYFTTNMAFVYLLKVNFPIKVPSADFTSKKIDSEPSFSVITRLYGPSKLPGKFN